MQQASFEGALESGANPATPCILVCWLAWCDVGQSAGAVCLPAARVVSSMSKLAPSPGVLQHISSRNPRGAEPSSPAWSQRSARSARSTTSSFRASRRIHSARSTLDQVRAATNRDMSVSGPSHTACSRDCFTVGVTSSHPVCVFRCVVSASVAAAAASPSLPAAIERMDSCPQRVYYARRCCTPAVPVQLPASRSAVLDAPGYEVC